MHDRCSWDVASLENSGWLYSQRNPPVSQTFSSLGWSFLLNHTRVLQPLLECVQTLSRRPKSSLSAATVRWNVRRRWQMGRGAMWQFARSFARRRQTGCSGSWALRLLQLLRWCRHQPPLFCCCDTSADRKRLLLNLQVVWIISSPEVVLMA